MDIARLEGLCQRKNSNDTVGNRTRNLLTCVAVPQPTAPPLAPADLLQNIFNPYPANVEYMVSS